MSQLLSATNYLLNWWIAQALFRPTVKYFQTFNSCRHIFVANSHNIFKLSTVSYEVQVQQLVQQQQYELAMQICVSVFDATAILCVYVCVCVCACACVWLECSVILKNSIFIFIIYINNSLYL